MMTRPRARTPPEVISHVLCVLISGKIGLIVKTLARPEPSYPGVILDTILAAIDPLTAAHQTSFISESQIINEIKQDNKSILRY